MIIASLIQPVAGFKPGEYRSIAQEICFDPIGFLFRYEKPYRLKAFLNILHLITDAQYWKCLEFIYTSKEIINHERSIYLKLLHSKRRFRKLLMSRNDRKALDEMPEVLTVYRGYQAGRYRNKSRLSWSLSKETAEWFAYRCPDNGNARVAVGTCLSSNVIAYMNERQEQEIIIDPKNVTGVKIITELGPDPFKCRVRQTNNDGCRHLATAAEANTVNAD